MLCDQMLQVIGQDKMSKWHNVCKHKGTYLL